MFLIVAPTNRQPSSAGNSLWDTCVMNWQDVDGPFTIQAIPSWIITGAATLGCYMTQDGTIDLWVFWRQDNTFRQFSTWEYTANSSFSVPVQLPFGPWYVDYVYSGSDEVLGSVGIIPHTPGAT